MEKVTKRIVKYPPGMEPDFVVPKEYSPYRYALGKKGNNMLACVGMNPSAAREEYSDATVTKVIRNAQLAGYNGWLMLNIYPERATEAKNMDLFNFEWHKNNIDNMIKLLNQFNIKEVWGAWGDIDMKQKYLTQVKNEVIKSLKENNIKIFYFTELSKIGNPKHPLYIKIDFNNKHYL